MCATSLQKHYFLYVFIHVKNSVFSEENTDSDIEELNDLIGNLHPYCCKPEKVASKSSRSDSDTNDKESSEEENISPNSVEINWAEH